MEGCREGMEINKIGYSACALCPHTCMVNREQGQMGICGESSEMRISWIGLHRGEEPPFIGEYGSGTIFFTGCPLHCAYCQNCQISRQGTATGVVVTVEELAGFLVDLQHMGAANANFVTGTHFIPSIIAALEIAQSRGFSLPVVWNSSGFERVEALTLIDPYIDTYLIDVKTLDVQVAARFCGSSRYAQIIIPVIKFLIKHHPHTFIDTNGVLQGIVVRHLVFPKTLAATEEFLHWFAQHVKVHAWLSLMVQFVPPEGGVELGEITAAQYDYLMDILTELEIEEGFVQELADNIPWIPDFSRDNPFPADFATPLDTFLQLRNSR